MSDEVVTIEVPLPDEAVMMYAEIGIIGYLREDGSQGYALRASGDAPMTSFLGLMVIAMDEVKKWGQRG